MKSFKVYAKKAEEYKAEIVAKSKEEAIEKAENDFCSFYWKEIDGTLETNIINEDEISESKENLRPIRLKLDKQ